MTQQKRLFSLAKVTFLPLFLFYNQWNQYYRFIFIIISVPLKSGHQCIRLFKKSEEHCINLVCNAAEGFCIRLELHGVAINNDEFTFVSFNPLLVVSYPEKR